MKRPAMPTKPAPSAKVAELRGSSAGQENGSAMRQLHRRAAAHLQKHRENPRSEAKFSKSNPDPRRLLHELQVHQVELEMQNAELQEARNRMEAMLENYTDLYDFAPIGYLTLDHAGAIREVNLAGASLLGMARSALVKWRFVSFISPADRSIFDAFLKQIFKSGNREICDVRLLVEGKHPVDLRIRANTFDSRQACRMALTDITDRKIAEAATAELAAIVKYSEDAIIGEDPNNNITTWNKGAERIFGYSAREVVGTSIMRLVPAAQREEESQIFTKIKFGESVQHIETLRQTKDGRLINVSVTASPIKDATGKVIGVSKVARDITRRKQVEKAQRRVDVLTASNQKLNQEIVRRQAVEESLKKSEQHQIRSLEQSRQMQEQLRHLSHQLLSAQEEERKKISRELHDQIGQTLTGINVHLAALKKAAAINPGGLARQIARTQKLVEHSVQIVHRFARELRPAVLDDLGLIPALQSFMKNFTSQTGVRARLTVFAEVQQLDMTRRTVLFRVAQEALGNVARHAQASRVEVSIQKMPDGVCMKIKDDGKSFRVQRVLLAQGRKHLGLLGMRERLEMVGGRFDVNSAPGKGTTITAQIPVSQARLGRSKNSAKNKP